jgi:predicted regulator of Ras-like GTPase activity (Roadblock/LC7/MglB family)
MNANVINREPPQVQRVELGHHCLQALREVVNQTRGVTRGVIATADGFEIASVWPEGEHVGKISAMAASLFALGTTIGAQAHLKWCQSVVVECDDGKLVIRALNVAGQSLLIGLVAASNATLGSVIYATRYLSDALAEAVQRETT